jgi:hypothetical protein
MKLGLQLGDSRLPFVQLSVKRAYLPQVATLKGGKLATEIDELQFTFCEGCANGGQLLALSEYFLFFWFQPPNDRT